jgi:hypothetical protein
MWYLLSTTRRPARVRASVRACMAVAGAVARPSPRRNADSVRPSAGNAALKAEIQLSTSPSEISRSSDSVSSPLPMHA